MIALLLVALGAYLIGSIPFGLIVTKLAGLGDIRAIGSGNIGATNVLRTGSKKLALLTLALDFSKGFLVIYLVQFNSRAITPYAEYALIIAAAAPFFAVLGHMFPVWLRFKGGKGVACLFGLGFGIAAPIGGWMAMCWLTIFALSRYSSLSAILGIPAGLFIASRNPDVALSSVLLLAVPTLMMIVKHHENIRRLFKGEEHRFSFGSKKKEDG